MRIILTLLMVLLPYSTKANRDNGQPLLNLNHVIPMREVSSTIYHPSLPVNPNRSFVNRIGKVYTHLTVIEYAGQNKRKQANWLCRCKCGTEVVIFGGNLHSGHTTSCGCEKGLFKHGEGGKDQAGGGRSAEYQTLCGILQRCLNPNHASYADYGGRGIKVSEEWNTLEKFPAFLEHVGRRPSQKHSIDRWPDKNGGYVRGNMRWATAQQQQSNTRKNVYVTYEGETLCMRATARKYNLDDVTFGKRIRDGWSVRSAITTPCPPYQRRHASI